MAKKKKKYQLKYKRSGKMVRSKKIYTNYYEALSKCTQMNKGLKASLGHNRFVKCRVVQAKGK